MIIKEIREKLPDDSVIFENHAYDNSIIGLTLDGRVIYSYERMIAELMVEENMSYEESAEWICYNTIRALPYAGDKAPLIVQNIYGADYE